MKNTKKIIVILSVAMLLFAAFTLSACQRDFYKVEFFVDGELYSMIKVDKGGFIEDVPEVPEKDYYTGYWSVTDFDEINSDMKVYAVYEVAQFTLRFIVDGELYKEMTVKTDTGHIDLPDVPEKEGYFGQWSIGDFNEVRQSATVYAVYTELPKVISFYDGDNLVAAKAVLHGCDLTDIPAVPLDRDDICGRWVVKSDNGKKPADFSSITENMVVYSDYYARIGLNNTAAGTKELNVDFGDIMLFINAGERDGYYFDAWYYDPEFTQKVNFPCSFEKNTEIYARWYSDAGDDGFTFADGKITGYTGDKTEITAPLTYIENGKTKKVTAVAAGAFKNNTSLKKIVLPSTVTTIEEEAFMACPDLQEIGFADGSYIVNIGDSAFRDCVSLTSFEFSRQTKSIGKNAFYNCTAIASYPGLQESALEVIADGTFYGNAELQTVSLPVSLTEIGDEAFYGCTKAEFLFDDNNIIRTVGASAFAGCERLTAFHSEHVASIGDEAFAGCRSLTALFIPADVCAYKLFGQEEKSYHYLVEAENEEQQVISVYVPQSLYEVVFVPGTAGGVVADKALYDFYSVKSVVLHKGVKTVGVRAFGLSKQPTDGAFTIDFATTLTKISEYAFEGRNDMEEVKLPNSLTEIGEKAFCELDKLVSVEVNGYGMLEYVGRQAFCDTAWYDNYQGIIRLGQVALGVTDKYLNSVGKTKLNSSDFDDITTIAPYAFYGNAIIESVTIPDSVYCVYEYAFADCDKLASFSLSAKTNVGRTYVSDEKIIYLGSVLYNCDALKSLAVGAGIDLTTIFGDTTSDMDGNIENITAQFPVAFSELIIKTGEVTAIRKGLYDNLDFIKKLVIEEGITTIYDGAFLNCGAEEVTIPSTVIYIGYADEGYETVAAGESEHIYEGVFGQYLTTLVIDEDSSLQAIFPKAFSASPVSDILIPDKVAYIGEYAFGADIEKPVQSIRFVDSETELRIADRAFRNLSFAKENSVIEFPQGLIAIGESAFEACTDLSEVNLQPNVVTIGKNAFKNSGLKKIDLPYSVEFGVDSEGKVESIFGGTSVSEMVLRRPVTKIVDLFDGVAPAVLVKITVYGNVAPYQFDMIEGLENIVLTDTVEIGEYAFNQCISLEKITLPATVKSVGDYAFAGCSALTTFSVDSDSELEYIGEYAFKNASSLRSGYLPSGIKNQSLVGLYYGCSSLKELNTLPKSVVEIGDETFYGCVALESVELPVGLTKVGERAFYGCENLRFGDKRFDSLVSIGEQAFYNCILFDGIIGNNVQSVGDEAFFGCVALDKLTVASGKVSEIIDSADKISELKISSACTELSEEAFAGCTALQKIFVFATDGINTILDLIMSESDIPTESRIFVEETAYSSIAEETKEQLAGRLFVNPTSLPDAEFSFDSTTKSATIISIGDFSGTVLLLPAYTYREELSTDGTSHNVKYTVTAVGKELLAANTTVVEVVIPSSVVTLGDRAFKNSAVKTVEFEAGSSLTTIGVDCFRECGNLTEFDLPDSVTTIGDGAFYQSAVKELSTNSFASLRTIGAYAFFGCKQLATVDIGNTNIETIGSYAFADSGLNSFAVCENAKIKTIQAYVFDGCTNLDKNAISLPKSTTIDPNAFGQQ